MGTLAVIMRGNVVFDSIVRGNGFQARPPCATVFLVCLVLQAHSVKAQSLREQLLVPGFSSQSQQIATDGLLGSRYQLRLLVRTVNAAFVPVVRSQSYQVAPDASYVDSSGATYIYTLRGSGQTAPGATLALDNSNRWR